MLTYVRHSVTRGIVRLRLSAVRPLTSQKILRSFVLAGRTNINNIQIQRNAKQSATSNIKDHINIKEKLLVRGPAVASIIGHQRRIITMRIKQSSAALGLLAITSAFAFQPSSPMAAVRRHDVGGLRVGTSHRPIPIQYTSFSSLSATTQNDNSDKEVATIQILMSDTGGGHRASANALRDAFNVLHETEPSRYPLPIHCDIVDIYTDYGVFPYNQYVAAYKFMAEYTFLWKWVYESGATPLGLWMYDFVLELLCFGTFKECLSRNPLNINKNDKRADLVVSVHPLCQDLPLKILTSLDTNGISRKEGRTTPFVTVVTDLGGAHPSWFHERVDKCYVPSDVLRNAALDRNVNESKIVQYGLPIRRGFWRFGADYSSGAPEKQDEAAEMAGVHHKPTIRQQLGLVDLPTVLIVGGGDGMGGIVSQAKAVGERLQKLAVSSSSSYQMVVVCGNNKSAQATLSPPQMQWGDNIKVRVEGFVNNMDEFMRASGMILNFIIESMNYPPVPHICITYFFRHSCYQSWSGNNRRGVHLWFTLHPLQFPSRTGRRKCPLRCRQWIWLL